MRFQVIRQSVFAYLNLFRYVFENICVPLHFKVWEILFLHLFDNAITTYIQIIINNLLNQIINLRIFL